ncbi:signal recognition particle-docking protein FtsY [Culicoidibacter larvae]|uniref:Signal recognition particle receptor FtsY n=1 Tax=Culicoidibacter larvae TaxID=2579976 RepID=A0A5R8Q8S2_9FIRM|nr:signal recognition particle-docking protein FtsY [Culicoidibacter larvae]TLG72108.1 signal recognition particle-docking protein FtsY [Culicoidibacter larvae]
MSFFSKFKNLFKGQEQEEQNLDDAKIIEPATLDAEETLEEPAAPAAQPVPESSPVAAEEVKDAVSAGVSQGSIEQAQDYHQKMSKSRSGILSAFGDLMSRFQTVDEEYFEELEDILIMADVGVTTVTELTDELRREVQRSGVSDPRALNEVIVNKLYDIYNESISGSRELNMQHGQPTVILMIGVNGAGKTTTIGKLAEQFKSQGKKVLLAAGDTFRAGAIDQLAVWAQRANVDIVLGTEGGDPSAVMFDAMQKAKNGNYDVVLCDTAGRLQNKTNLMNELAKIRRIIDREYPGAPHETLLVVDATTGQNGLSQARAFTEVAPISGVVLTKLDGTAKGGIVLAIGKELGIPVKYIGLGEKITDLEPFRIENYLYGLFAEMFE